MAGKTYGQLVGIAKCGNNPANGNAIWQFVCSCGARCEIDGYAVRIGKATSCKACGAERLRLASVKHGMSESREFATWIDIQTRCLNPNATSFPDYGGRGIEICDRWLNSFMDFYADMGPKPSRRHSIERDDVNGNYEPGNCRWATAIEQARNRRNTSRITIDGVTKTLQEWAEENNLLASTLVSRQRAGVDGARLLQPSRTGGRLTFNGITDTYRGWGSRTGIKPSTIAMRLTRYGWSVEKALTKGATL